MTPEVGSVWIVTKDRPLSAGVKKGEVVTVVSVLKPQVSYTGSICAGKWVANTYSWEEYFTPFISDEELL